MDLFGNEQWYDCETHTPVDLKETLKTPPRRSSIQIECPPAPHRRSLLNHSPDEIKNKSKEDEIEEEGICPLDGTFELIQTEDFDQPSNSKRQRRNEDVEESVYNTKMQESITEEESQYSNLFYFEVSGAITIRRQSMSSTSRDECDRRECKMQISYRVNKEVSNDIQIALIVYKNNSNLRSRRNLMLEFSEKAEESLELPTTPISNLMLTPSSSRCRTVTKERPSIKDESLISTAPCGEKVTKAIKRPIASRNCLRF